MDAVVNGRNRASFGLGDFHIAHTKKVPFIDAPLLGGGERCLLYTSPSPRDLSTSRMPSSA